MKNKVSIKICGTGRVGPKGQVVISKNIRDIMDIKPGDSVAFLLTDNKFVGFVKNDQLENIIEYAKAGGIDIK